MKKKKRIVYNLCLAVLICIFLGSAGYLAYYFLQSKKSEDQFQELEAMIDARSTKRRLSTWQQMAMQNRD